MAELILEVKEKSEIDDLKKLGTITHVSLFTNTIILDAPQTKIPAIKKNSNVLSVHESQEWTYQD
jgi:hypothetical protein